MWCIYGSFPLVFSSHMLRCAAALCRLRTSATWRWCRERGGVALGGCLCGVLRRYLAKNFLFCCLADMLA